MALELWFTVDVITGTLSPIMTLAFLRFSTRMRGLAGVRVLLLVCLRLSTAKGSGKVSGKLFLFRFLNSSMVRPAATPAGPPRLALTMLGYWMPPFNRAFVL